MTAYTKKQLRKSGQAYLFIAPLLIGLILFCYFPPVSGLYHSFFDWDAAYRSIFIGLGNFRELFRDPNFLNSIPTMFKIMIPKLIIGIVVPLLVAEIIFGIRSSQARYTYRVGILLPIVAPGVVGMMIWKFIYDPHDGPITALAKFFGFLGQGEFVAWLNDPHTVIPAIIFLGFPWVSGTSVLIYMSGLMNISTEIIESSKLDGATVFQRILKIDIPMLLGQIKYFLVFGIIGGLQDYSVQIILTQGGPGYSTFVPGYYMFYKAFNVGRMGYAASVGTTLFIAILLLTIMNYKFFKTDMDR
jgi:ABC-type sugar transport system permease subunit